MAHTYVILKQEFLPPGTTGPTPAAPDPQVRITGTVDGTEVFVMTWFSVINQASAIAYMNAVTPLLLAAYNSQQPPATQTPPLTSWTV